MVYTVDLIYTVDLVYNVELVYTVDTGDGGTTMGKTGLRPETSFGKLLLHANVHEYFQIEKKKTQSP